MVSLSVAKLRPVFEIKMETEKKCQARSEGEHPDMLSDSHQAVAPSYWQRRSTGTYFGHHLQ